MLRRRSMSGNRRVKDSGLPEGYYPMNSVRNKSGQYFDTGVIPTENTRVVIDVQLRGTSILKKRALFGVGGENKKQYMCYYDDSNLAWCMLVGDGSTTASISSTQNSRVKIDFRGDTMTIGDETVTSANAGQALSTENSIYLFAYNYDGVALNDCIASIYSCKIYEGSRLVRDYVPAFNVASRNRGLFDKVQGTFRTLTSLTDFIGAQDVNGMLWSEEDWDGSVEPNGVAIITSNCSFVVALENAPTSLPTDSESALDSSSLPVILSTTSAKKDYAGLDNTQVMLSDYGDDVAEAAGYCNNYIFPNGNKGYLPSLGEMNTLYSFKSSLGTILGTIGGTAPADNQYFKTSTRARDTGGYTAFWRFNWETGALYGEAGSTARQVRPFTTLDPYYGYKNE